MEVGIFLGATLLIVEEWAKSCFCLPKGITQRETMSLLAFPLISKSSVSFPEGYTLILA